MGALLLRTITDCGPETDDRGLVFLLAGLGDGIVDGSKVTRRWEVRPSI